jgi:hypothetical protein
MSVACGAPSSFSCLASDPVLMRHDATGKVESICEKGEESSER